MTTPPQVCIIVPLFNDEEHVIAALESARAQTLREIEIICVDDASTDSTVSLVEAYLERDARITLIRQPENSSAFQCRRVGVNAASAPYVLFLDGDDELDPRAAETTVRIARARHADVVGFGVDVVASDGQHPRRFESTLQPRYAALESPRIVPSLFPPGEDANGHVWRYLFATSLLTSAYEGVSADQRFYRANDLPLTFLALAFAARYCSTTERLYRYHFRRGTSGRTIRTHDDFRFLLSGVDPIAAIEESVNTIAASSTDGESLVASYRSARLHMIGNVLRNWNRDTSGDLQAECFALLEGRVGLLDVIRAAAGYAPDTISAVSAHSSKSSDRRPSTSTPKRVLISTANLQTGGLQGVVLAQARQLAERGFDVTLAVSRADRAAASLPHGVTLIETGGGDSPVAQIDRWLEICEQHDIDVIIDHHILYNQRWPQLVLAARAIGVPTIGWLHNFALRPLFDGSTRGEFLMAHLRLLHRVVVLSPTDVAYWKIRGLDRIVHLPNPPSQLALGSFEAGRERTRAGGRLELVWWGRLDPATKQVDHLIRVASHLRSMDVDFRMRIIGPDSSALSADELRLQVSLDGVDDYVEVLGDHTPSELLSALTDAEIFVLPSAIEGSPLTIVEAQALGLPIVMYDLPWVTTVLGNDGLLTTTPGDAREMAERIRDLALGSERYAAMSRAARTHAAAVADVDTAQLLVELLTDRLSEDWSPEPTLADAQLIIEWMARFSDRNLRSTGRLSALNRERDHARQKLREVMRGPSYRIGRAVTYLPRAVHRALQRRDG